MKIETEVPIGRFTTLGAGGTARAFARPKTVEDVSEALAWARDRDLPVATIGLGSNLLVADDGVEALVLKLDGELSSAGVEGNLLVAGGGATNAVCLHRARAPPWVGRSDHPPPAVSVTRKSGRVLNAIAPRA